MKSLFRRVAPQNAAQGFFGGGGSFAGPLSNSQLTGARESTGQLLDFLPVRLNTALAGRALSNMRV